MNRIIKYRAWDKEKKKMFWVSKIDLPIFDSGAIMLLNQPNITEVNDTWQSLGSVELMQFTGLLDKNCREIFKGDILEKYHCGIKSFGELKTDGMRWWIEDKLNETNWENMDITSGKFCKIIGNVYENPELLNK